MVPPGRHVLVGRMPVLDRQMQVVGYSLEARATGEAASPEGIWGAMIAALAREPALIRDRLAFMSPPLRLVESGEIELLPEGKVLRLPASGADEKLLRGCQRLVSRGFRLCLSELRASSLAHPLGPWSELVERGVPEELLKLVSFVELDVGEEPAEDPLSVVDGLRRAGLDVVARGVCNRELLSSCSQAGFDLYEGYLLSRPDTVISRSLSPRQAICMQLLSRLADHEVSMEEVVGLLLADVGLSYRVLRAASLGADHGARREVSSVKEATVMMGQRRLASFLALMLLAGEGGGQSDMDLLVLALSRSRMTELLSEQVLVGSGAEGFTVGLLSCLELLLGAPLASAIDEFPVPKRVREAVVEGGGVLGGVLADVLSYEVGDLERVSTPEVTAEQLEEAYLGAVRWAYGVTLLQPALEAA